MEILILDKETSGFNTNRNKIVEIGITELNLETGERKIIFDQVMKEPGLTLAECEKSWVCQNSTLDPKTIMDSYRLDFHRGKIQDLYHKYPLGVTAFNSVFDFRFADSRGFIYHKLPCLMKLCRPIVEALDKNGRVKNPSAQEAYDFFFPDSGYVELHRAGDDSFHESAIALKLYELGILIV
jgi:hypothetical protein